MCSSAIPLERSLAGQPEYSVIIRREPLPLPAKALISSVATFARVCYKREMEIRFTAVYRKFPEGYAAFVEELPGRPGEGYGR